MKVLNLFVSSSVLWLCMYGCGKQTSDSGSNAGAGGPADLGGAGGSAGPAGRGTGGGSSAGPGGDSGSPSGGVAGDIDSAGGLGGDAAVVGGSAGGPEGGSAGMAGESSAPCNPTCAGSFVSSSEWEAFAGTVVSTSPATYTLGADLGPAGYFCTNSTVSATCTPTASNAGAFAYWIWRNDVTPTQIVDFQTAIFRKSFVVGANPSGKIQIDANDFAAVFVNDVWVGQVGSVSDVSIAFAAQSAHAQFDLSPALHPGVNTITVAVENGPPSFAGGCSGGCVFSQNAAVVGFSGTLSWQ